MKFFSYVLFAVVLFSGMSILAAQENVDQRITRDESGESSSQETWYDRADQLIEEFTGISQTLYVDAAQYQQWRQKITDLMTQFMLQEQLQAQFFQQVQAALESSIQRIQALEARRQVDIMQAKQEQFDVDGQKAGELIEVIEGIKRDFSRLVIPEREALFTQLERFTAYLKEQMQKNSLQAQQVIQALQDHARVVLQ